jgi:pimeloyl-ACP methyl ester carboxylesterase
MPVAKLLTGIDLYFECHGHGEPIVFIPGTGFAGNVWMDSQVEELARSHQVIIHDPRGCGRTTHAKGVYTIDLMANDVVALLEHMGVPHAHVIGHSMGGRIGLSIALNFPGKVKSLVIAAGGSGPAGKDGTECVPGLPFRLAFELIDMGFEGYVKHEICDSDTYFTPSFRYEHPEKVKAFYQMVWSHHAKLEEYVRLVLARSNWEATHRLGDVAIPTLVVVGDSDVVGANHVKQSAVLINRIPGVESKILSGQSHGFFWQAPRETNAWITEWVKRH